MVHQKEHQNNNLNVMIEFAKYLDCDTTFYNINKKEMIISFLDTKIKIVTMTQIYTGLC